MQTEHDKPPRASPDSGARTQRPQRRFARWRALSLSLVYVAFAAHIIHWKLAGRTLAPLELNEVMYTLELGIVTAGFLFMGFLVLGSLIFGRFFCSWACHIMVLQDLCAWILRKLGISRKPIRSRLLLWVPPLTAAYMFLWPQIPRAIRQQGFPEFHLRTDAEGWASFATENFWRNLPSIPVVVVTFLVCGFVIVYLLGSRSFCTYVCPYGAVFGLVDRFSPGRIKVNDQCRQCGTCTAACTSGIRVHDELREHGRVVNPACLKDLDCVGSCPHGALSYGLGRPAILASLRSRGRFGSARWDFSLGEELLMGFLFLFTLLSLRGLYSRVPFLLSLAAGACTGLLVVVALRLLRQRDVRLAGLDLRSNDRLTPRGVCCLALTAVLVAFIGHSAAVRWHEYLGLRGARAVAQAEGARTPDEVRQVWDHLARAAALGLLRNERVERAQLDVGWLLGEDAAVERVATRLIDDHPDDLQLHLRRARVRARLGREGQARGDLEVLLARAQGSASRAAILPVLGGLEAGRGRFPRAVQHLEAALANGADGAAVHAELGAAYAALGRGSVAERELRLALQLDDSLQPAWFNLGGLLAVQGHLPEARTCLRRAVALDPRDAQARLNLDRVQQALLPR